jgi:hypothetical protein
MMQNRNVRNQNLQKRLRYLWSWELFDSLFFPVLVIVTAKLLQEPLGFLSIYSTGLVSWLLLQGAYYWWLKLQAVKNGDEINPGRLKWFRTFKWVNGFLIGVFPLFLIGKSLFGMVFISRLDGIASMGLYLLGFLEQVNYYHYQLMYDYAPDWRSLIQHKRLKRASLSRALQKMENTNLANQTERDIRI